MKTETRTVFIAFDGTPFDTEEACLRHERENVASRLVSLTIEQVVAAIERRDKKLGDAIEAVASKIKRARLDDGDLKRPRKAKGGTQGEPGQQQQKDVA